LTGEVSDSDNNLLATYTWLADEIKVGVVDNDGHGLEYSGSLILALSSTYQIRQMCRKPDSGIN
jgi:hypothetical protein